MSTLKIKNTDGSWVSIPMFGGGESQTGSTPSVTLTTEILSSDKSVQVSQTGTVKNPEIKIGIPKGITGDAGLSPDSTTLVVKNGNQGSVSGFYTSDAVEVQSVTINQDSNSYTYLANSATINVSNGSTDTCWAKTVLIKDSSTTVSLGDAWVWAGGKTPTISNNCLLSLYWYTDVGIAEIIRTTNEG